MMRVARITSSGMAFSRRSRQAVLSASVAGGASLLASSSAFAACQVTGTDFVTVTCASTTTTNTTNTTTPNASTVDRVQRFNANVISEVQAGATVDTYGLFLDSTAANGHVSFTNNGTLTRNAVGIQGALSLQGNGGGVSYTGSGNLLGNGGNNHGIEIYDQNPSEGPGALTFNATGGSVQSNGFANGVVIGGNVAGGMSYTSSGGHTITVGNTIAVGTNSGITISNVASVGNTTVVSGSAITATGAGIDVRGISIQHQTTGNVSVTSSGLIDLSAIAGTTRGVYITHGGTTGNASVTLNADVTTGTGTATGIDINFVNAAGRGVGTINVNGTVNTRGSGVRINALSSIARTHQVSVGAGGTLAASTVSSVAGIQVSGTNQSLNLINAGTISSTLGTAVSVGSGSLTGSNSGSISGVTGIAASAGGSSFVNAGSVTGTGGTALQFLGNGNTLELQSGFSFAGNVLGGTAGNTLVLGGSANGSFDASLVGTQFTGFDTFSKTGSSTWTLTGASPVIAWSILAGTLSGNGGTSIAGNVAVSSGATLDFNQTGNGTYAGIVSGAGDVTKSGAATLTIGSNNTYTGTTTVNAGTLALGAGGSIASSRQLNLAAAGTTFDISAANAQIQTLAGVAGSQIALGSRTLTIANGSTTYAGSIGGTGGLTLQAGSFGLSGTNTYSGATTVNGGTLSVNGAIASSATTVNAAGTLGGTGTLGNVTINGGTLAPGNSIGTLTVQGNLVFTSASTYMVEIDPNGADRTNVTGTATLGGAGVSASFASGSYVARRYTLVNAQGGASGTFNAVASTNLPANFTTALNYDANNAYLDIALAFTPTPTPTPTPGGPNAPAYTPLTINQRNVANGLINSFNTAGGIPLVFGALSATGLTQVSGEHATGTQQTTFDAMDKFVNVLTDPFMGTRAGGASASASTGYSDEDESLAYAAAQAHRRRARGLRGIQGAAEGCAV